MKCSTPRYCGVGKSNNRLGQTNQVVDKFIISQPNDIILGGNNGKISQRLVNRGHINMLWCRNFQQSIEANNFPCRSVHLITVRPQLMSYLGQTTPIFESSFFAEIELIAPNIQAFFPDLPFRKFAHMNDNCLDWKSTSTKTYY